MRFDKHTVLADDTVSSQSTDDHVFGPSRNDKLERMLKNTGQLSDVDRQLLANILRKRGIDHDAVLAKRDLDPESDISAIDVYAQIQTMRSKRF